MPAAGRPSSPLPLLVVTTVGSHDDARRLARELVDLKLAACAQVEPIESTYRWKGEVASDCEYRVLFKTTEAQYEQVEAALRQRHPYELPAIHAVLATRAEAAYAQWVAAMGETTQPT